MCADHAEAAGDGRTAAADVNLAGDIVKIDPIAVRTGDDALGAQNAAEMIFIGQRIQDATQLVLGKAACRFGAPASEDLIRVMVMMVMVVMMMVMLVVIIVVMVMMVVVLMVIIVVMVMMMVAAFVIIVVIMVMMVVAAFVIIVVIMVMMVMMLMLLLKCLHFGTQPVFLHGLTNLLSVQFAP